MKSLQKFFVFIFLISLFASCNNSTSSNPTMKREVRFSLDYGAFEDQIQLYNFDGVQDKSPASCFMRDGFFYISSNISKKIMQFNSYGDLLSVYYNDQTNPKPSFAKDDSSANNVTDIFSDDSKNNDLGLSTRKAVSYQFNNPSILVADQEKNIYIVDQVPAERQILDQEYRFLLKDVVVKFSTDGSFVNYLGQEGPGGTPFPLIQGVFTNNKQELIVVSRISTGYIVFWFEPSGKLKYKIPIYEKNLPNPEEDESKQVFTVVEKIIPDSKSETLYIKMDIFENDFDDSTNVNSGLNFEGSYIYSFSIENGVFEDMYKVPSFVSKSENQVSFEKPYELLGIATNNKFYFSSPDETGYTILILDLSSLAQIKRHLDVLPEENEFENIFLTDQGIICGLFATEYSVNVVWWRTDLLFSN